MSEIEKAIIQLKSDINTYQNVLNGANGELDADAIKIINASIKVYKTAIQALEEKLIKECGAVGDGITDDTEAIQNIIDALEKKVPKKVTHEASIRTCCTCPSCLNVVDEFEKFGNSTVRVTYSHCKFCGQKLDWSEPVVLISKIKIYDNKGRVTEITKNQGKVQIKRNNAGLSAELIEKIKHILEGLE